MKINKLIAAMIMAAYLSVVAISVTADMTRVSGPQDKAEQSQQDK